MSDIDLEPKSDIRLLNDLEDEAPPISREAQQRSGEDLVTMIRDRRPGFFQNEDGESSGDSFAVFTKGAEDDTVDYLFKDGTPEKSQWIDAADADQHNHDRRSMAVRYTHLYSKTQVGFEGIAFNRGAISREIEIKNGMRPDDSWESTPGGTECDVGISMDRGKTLTTGYRHALHEIIGHCGPDDMMGGRQQEAFYGLIAQNIPYKRIRGWIADQGGDSPDAYIQNYLHHYEIEETIDKESNFRLRFRNDERDLLVRHPQTGELHIDPDAVQNLPKSVRQRLQFFIEEGTAFDRLTRPDSAQQHEDKMHEWKGWTSPESDPGPSTTEQSTIEWISRVYRDIDAVYHRHISREDFQRRHETILGLENAPRNAIQNGESRYSATTIEFLPANSAVKSNGSKLTLQDMIGNGNHDQLVSNVAERISVPMLAKWLGGNDKLELEQQKYGVDVNKFFSYDFYTDEQYIDFEMARRYGRPGDEEAVRSILSKAIEARSIEAITKPEFPLGINMPGGKENELVRELGNLRTDAIRTKEGRIGMQQLRASNRTLLDVDGRRRAVQGIHAPDQAAIPESLKARTEPAPRRGGMER